MKKITLINMGGARSKEELKEFLFNMFMDKRIINSNIRYLLAPLISNLRYKKVWQNYKKINGSRIYELTYKLAKKIESISEYRVDIVMRYTKPYVEEIDENSIAIPLYPHFSLTTYQSVIDKLKDKNIKVVEPFFREKEFNKIVANKINSSISNHNNYHLIFSAHGLPKKLVTKFNDRYEKDIQENVALLKPLLKNFKSIHIAYQSRFGFSKWLTPYLDEKLKEFKGENVLIYPISFLIDNSETDLELKIEYKHLANKIGIKEYKVIECLNDSNELANFIIQLAKRSENETIR